MDVVYTAIYCWLYLGPTSAQRRRPCHSHCFYVFWRNTKCFRCFMFLHHNYISDVALHKFTVAVVSVIVTGYQDGPRYKLLDKATHSQLRARAQIYTTHGHYTCIADLRPSTETASVSARYKYGYHIILLFYLYRNLGKTLVISTASSPKSHQSTTHPLTSCFS